MSIPLGSCLKPKKWRVTVTDTLQTYIPIWRNYSKWPVGHVRRRVLTLMHSNFGPVGKWQVFSSGAQCVNYVLLVRSEAEKMVLEPAWVSSFFFLLIWTLPYLPLCSFLSWNGFTPLESMSHTRQTCKLLVSGHVHACKQTLICWWFENIANFEIYQPPCAPFLPSVKSVITW